MAAGAVGGVAAVSVGLHFVTAVPGPALVAAHRRLTLLGFLGLTVVGVSLQFYPPNVGRWPGCTDRTALVVVAALTAGVAVQAAGLAATEGILERAGVVLVLAGTLGYGYLLGGAFATR